MIDPFAPTPAPPLPDSQSTTTPTLPPRPAPFEPSPEAIKAVLTSMVMMHGEPLINPTRISLSLSRATVQSSMGRRLYFEYIQDDLNPFGRLDLIVVDA